jgi:hypothetical protein
MDKTGLGEECQSLLAEATTHASSVRVFACCRFSRFGMDYGLCLSPAGTGNLGDPNSFPLPSGISRRIPLLPDNTCLAAPFVPVTFSHLAG